MGPACPPYLAVEAEAIPLCQNINAYGLLGWNALHLRLPGSSHGSGRLDQDRVAQCR